MEPPTVFIPPEETLCGWVYYVEFSLLDPNLVLCPYTLFLSFEPHSSSP